jgi:hypothetical protein
MNSIPLSKMLKKSIHGFFQFASKHFANRVFTWLTGDILAISVFMQTNGPQRCASFLSIYDFGAMLGTALPMMLDGAELKQVQGTPESALAEIR